MSGVSSRQKGCRMPFEVCKDYDAAKPGECITSPMTAYERERYHADEETLHMKVRRLLEEGVDVGEIAQTVGLGKNIIIAIKGPKKCWGEERK